ncbi:MAG: hypothetical protein IKY83_06825 [Proteobacteria bacterium]|nr:hypothetical protein [Pseudomonadota bacterium]
MAEQHRMMISVDGGEAQPCMKFDVNEIWLGEHGIADPADAVVGIRCDSRQELYIYAMGSVQVLIERSGRVMRLGEREICLLMEDTICFGDHRIAVVSVRKLREHARLRLPTFKKMLSAAAAFVIAAIPACQPKVVGKMPASDDQSVDAAQDGTGIQDGAGEMLPDDASDKAEVEGMHMPENKAPGDGAPEAEADSGDGTSDADMRLVGDGAQTAPTEGDAAQNNAAQQAEALMEDSDKATGQAQKAAPEVVEVKKRVVKPRRLAGKPPAGPPRNRDK